MYLRDILVASASFKGRNTVNPRQHFEAADRLSCDTTLIGKNQRDLTMIFQNEEKNERCFAPGGFASGSRLREIPRQLLIAAEF